MMDSSKVYEIAAKMHADDVETNESETKANVEETKVDTAEQTTADVPKNDDKIADANTPKEEVKDEAKPENSNEKVVEKDESNKESDNPENKETEHKEKKVFTKQEQIDYAFKREKSKRKKLEQRIRELEEENKKYKQNYTLEDFKNNTQDYVNYLVDKKSLELEKQRLKDEYTLSRQEEYNAINEQRIENCFPDENSRNAYDSLLKSKGAAFVKELDDEDPDQVVLGYLDDCDVSPLMIQILMTNEQYKNQVLSKHSPYMKLRALEDLENRIKYAQAELAKKQNSTVPEKNEDTKPVEQVKPAIPVVGSVTKSDQSNGNVVKDYNSILHQLNARRYG